jgi:protein O-GlcNAc transferase
VELAIEQTLQQAITAHQDGKLEDAEALYQSILEIHPTHPEANHNLGVLVVSVNQPEAALPLFKTALDANPSQGQFWLSYIDALIKTNQLESAKSVLNQGKQLGLAGEAVKALEAQLAQTFDSSDPLINLDPVRGPSQMEVNALLEHHQTGRYDQMESLAKTITQKYPDHSFAWRALGAVFGQTGRAQEAVSVNQKAVELSPTDEEAHNNLGATLQALGRFEEAEASCRNAIAIKPEFADAHNNLGNTLKELGRLEEAQTCYKKALIINPEYAAAHNNLGVTLQALGRLEEAAVSYQKAIAIKPEFAEVYSNLGNIFFELGRLNEAAVSYQKAIAIKPEFADAHSNLSNTFHELGQLNEAEASCRRALELKPEFASAHSNLGRTLQALGRLEEAQTCYKKALTINPEYAEAYGNLGVTLQALGRLEEAAVSYQKAIAIKPEFVEVYSNLGNIFFELGRLNEAAVSYQKAIAIKPEFADAHNNLGNTLSELGRLNEAEASCRRALELKPDLANAHSNLILICSQAEGGTNKLFGECLRFRDQYEKPLRNDWPIHGNQRDPERCLKIGFVSGDFRQHPIADFIEPLLAHLATYPQLSLYAYYTYMRFDHITERLKKNFVHWHSTYGSSDIALAKKIQLDEIDILIDLSGHTGFNRLQTFARKPAPVQVSWMGYPGTTGLMAMDYFFGDRFWLPPGTFDAQFTEKIVQLPASSPFQPLTALPPVNLLPSLKKGYVTFGSFNRANKLNQPIIALWSKLLREVPNSRMLLGGISKEVDFNRLTDWFSQEGISNERLSFHQRCSIDIYLRLHYQVDICLDTFPYGGGTTTLYALLMGIPTLTLAGETVPSRVGVCLQSHVGMTNFISHNRAEFVEKGLYWASHLSELAEIRAVLRERFSKSAMGQSSVVASAVERTLRIIWQRWCAGLPAETFEVDTDENTSR